MSTEDRIKWDKRYRDMSHGTNALPSAFLSEQISELDAQTSGNIEPGLRALDIACGAGRNSIYLGQLGYLVDAMDISSQGLVVARERAAGHQAEINWLAVDLDEIALRRVYYDLIIVFRYKNAGIMSQVSGALRPGGVLLCEQHLQTDQDVVGPAGNKFRWRPGELRQMVEGSLPKTAEGSLPKTAEGSLPNNAEGSLPRSAEGSLLNIEYYFEGIVEDPDNKPAALARLIARKAR
ncbi:MAG: class I SAM-dependent methyltransferase [Pseudomonadales bacterium]|nr:class I SAM-dependent methyltransferase [Pseudomonadales bacterium]